MVLYFYAVQKIRFKMKSTFTIIYHLKLASRFKYGSHTSATFPCSFWR